MTILVLAGGKSGEREVSLRSGAAVRTALRTAGHETTTLDPAEQALDQAAVADCDVVFPVLHGVGGEDGEIQQQLDKLGVAYVGSSVAASELCFDKWAYRQLLADNGLPVAQGELVTATNFAESPLSKAPFVLKPRRGGSSLDTIIARDPTTVSIEQIDALLEKYGEMLLEELIPGIEITVGVLGDQALPVIEIIPPSSGEFDYENKYNGASQELCPPLHVDEPVQKTARELAARIHALCGCADYSRTDMIVRPDGSLIVLETNTLPGMTDQSLLPKAAAANGLNMSQLCDRLVQLALSR